MESHRARQRRIKAGRPTSNGCVERAQLTILEECWRPSSPAASSPRSQPSSETSRSTFTYYNHDRAHTGRLTNGRIPADIVYGARKMAAAR